MARRYLKPLRVGEGRKKSPGGKLQRWNPPFAVPGPLPLLTPAWLRDPAAVNVSQRWKTPERHTPPGAAPRARLASPLAPRPQAGPGLQVAAGPGRSGAGPRAALRLGWVRTARLRRSPPPSRAAEGCAGPHGLQVSEGSAGPSGRAAGAAVGGGWAAGRAPLLSPRLLRRLFVCQHSHGEA